MQIEDFINDSPLQTIYYGAPPPGTGKSNTIKREVEDKGRIHFRTTFHPDSDYSTFVGCYKPTKNAAQVVVSVDELKQIGARIYTKGQLEDKGFSPSQDGIYLVYELKNKSQVALDGIDIDALINRGKATQLPHFEIIRKKQNAIQKV